MKLNLPVRENKPRNQGLTCLLDNGLPTRFFRDVVESSADLVDFVKFGWGTALVTKDIQEKISICRGNHVEFYFGGTLFEKAYQQDKVSEFRSFCKSHRTEWVEISNGTVELSNSRKAMFIAEFAQEFKVLSEVGYKETVRSQEMHPAKWVEYIKEDLAAGAVKVITEARESGKSGICRADGELRFGLIAEILDSGIEKEQLIFEAPTKALQTYFIQKLGPSVNLANISFDDTIALETLRLGLRSDTLSTFENGKPESGIRSPEATH